MLLSFSFKSAGDDEAFFNALDLAGPRSIAILFIPSPSHILIRRGRQSHQHAAGRESVELTSLRHAHLHRSGKTAAHALAPFGDGVIGHPHAVSLCGTISFMLRHASCPCLVESPRDASCHFRRHRSMSSLCAALLVPMLSSCLTYVSPSPANMKLTLEVPTFLGPSCFVCRKP